MVFASSPEPHKTYGYQVFQAVIDPLSHLMRSQAGQHGPIILMYHSVTPGKGSPDWPWAVSMQRFRSQLDLLAAEGWATPTLAELVGAPKIWSGRTAVITFDDGYTDNLSAWDELHKRGMRATLFMVSGSIGREPAWATDGRPGGRLLNAVELRNMHAAGLEIGSHTINHIRLPHADSDQLRVELTESKAALEAALGSAITSFAYPYGASDERCAQAVQEAGYRSACTTRSGWALRDSDPYQLRRLTVFNTDTAGSLARKLFFGDNDASWSQVWRYTRGRLAAHIGL